MGEILGAYWREIHFYEELSARVPARTPRVYYSALTPDSTREKQDDLVRRLDRLPMWLVSGMLAIWRWVVAREAHRYVLLIEDMSPSRVGDQIAGGAPDLCLC